MRPQTRLIGLLSLVFLLAVLTSYLALQKAAGATSGIWFEVSKLGLQLAGITVIGGLVSLGFRLWEKLRDEDRQHFAEFLGELHDPGRHGNDS